MTRERVLAYLRYLALFVAVFVPAFIGAGLIGGLGGTRHALHLPSENGLPFLAFAVWGYLSLYPLYLLPLLHLGVPQMATLGRQSVFMMLVAAPFYIFLPGLNAYPQPEVTGVQGQVIDAIRQVDRMHNLVPSLHVAFAWLIVLAVRPSVGRSLGVAYMAWAGVLTVSTVLLHRHYLLDLATGIGLAVLASRIWPIAPAAAVPFGQGSIHRGGPSPARSRPPSPRSS